MQPSADRNVGKNGHCPIQIVLWNNIYGTIIPYCHVMLLFLIFRVVLISIINKNNNNNDNTQQQNNKIYTKDFIIII